MALDNPKGLIPTPTGGFFITGTDTDVGKTFVSGCIAKTLRAQGIIVAPRKPIASGCIRQPDGTLLSEDALFLQQSCQSEDSLDTICPYRFEPAISPQTAIKQTGFPLNIKDLKTACTVNDQHLALVEGAGGFYSPLALDGLNKDLAIELSYPVILVVANKIGCINQALLSIAAIEQSGLILHSVIINHLSQDNTHHALGLADFTDFKLFETHYSANQTPTLIRDWQV